MCLAEIERRDFRAKTPDCIPATVKVIAALTDRGSGFGGSVERGDDGGLALGRLEQRVRRVVIRLVFEVGRGPEALARGRLLLVVRRGGHDSGMRSGERLPDHSGTTASCTAEGPG